MRRIIFSIMLFLLTPTLASGYSFVYGEVEMFGEASLSLSINNAEGVVIELESSTEFGESTQLHMGSTTPLGIMTYYLFQDAQLDTDSIFVDMSQTVYGNANEHPELYLEYVAEGHTTLSFPFEVVSDFGAATGFAPFEIFRVNRHPQLAPIAYQITDDFGNVLDLDLVNNLELNTTYQMLATLAMAESSRIETHSPDVAPGDGFVIRLLEEPPPAPVPEATTFLLLGFGGGVGAWIRRFYGKKRAR